MVKIRCVCLGSQYANWGGFDLEEKPDGSIGEREADVPNYSKDHVGLHP
jgi:hypothetical protein